MTSTSAKAKDKANNRVNIACERCRKRHIRCDGEEICRNCQRTKSECVYVEGEKKIVVSLKYIQNLQHEIERLKAAAGDAISSISSVNTTPENERPSMKRQRTEEADIKPIKNEPANEPQINIPSVDKAMPSMVTTNSKFFQGTSSLSMFGLEIKDIIPHKSTCELDFHELGQNSVHNRILKCKVKHINNDFECTVPKPNGYDAVIKFTLPGYDYVQSCHNMFNTYLSGCFYFFNVGDFQRKLYATFFDQTRSEDSYTGKDLFWYCQLLLVIGIGEMYLGQRSGKVVPRFPGMETYPGIYYFDKACDILNMAFDGRHQYHGYGIDAVEVLALYAFYHQMVHCSNGHYILSGLCMRCALNLGMHVEKTRDECEEVDCSVVEHRRRLWWTIYNMDRYLSAKSGFPLSIPDESILTALPQERDGLVGNYYYTNFPPASYIQSFIKMTQISSNMLMQLYQPSCVSSKNVLSIISSTMERLFEWKNELPAEFKIDFNATGDMDFEVCRTSTNIYSEYHQCVNLTVRPLLLHFVRKRLLDKKHMPIDLSLYSENVLTLLNASLEASIHTITCLKKLEEKRLFATYGYLDCEYSFTAASTLVMFNVAFALHNSSSRHISVALDMLLQAERIGNVNVTHRIEQLKNFISTFDFMDPKSKQTLGQINARVQPDLQTHSNQPIVNEEDITNVNTPVKQNLAQTSQQAAAGQYPPQPAAPPPPVTMTAPDQTQMAIMDELFSQALPYQPDAFGRKDNVEQTLWDEISNQGFWLGNVSDEFMSMIN